MAIGVNSTVYDLTKYIDNSLMDGRPHIRDRRMPVYIIAACAADNQMSVEEIADAYTISEAEVTAALLYYEQHKADIDAQEAAIEEEYRHYGDH